MVWDFWLRGFLCRRKLLQRGMPAKDVTKEEYASFYRGLTDGEVRPAAFRMTHP